MHSDTVIVAPASPARTINTPFAEALGVTDPAAYRDLRGKLRADLAATVAARRAQRAEIHASDTTRGAAQARRESLRLRARALHLILAGLRGRTRAKVITEPLPPRAHPRRKDPEKRTARTPVSFHWTVDAIGPALTRAGVSPSVQAAFGTALRRWWGFAS